MCLIKDMHFTNSIFVFIPQPHSASYTSAMGVFAPLAGIKENTTSASC